MARRLWAWLDRRFGVRRAGSDVGTELLAGVTTFVTMAYILLVQPAVLAAAGMDPGAVLVATALASGLASIAMGLYAGLPVALAPGMGLNAYFAYAVVQGMGIPWPVALGAVFLDGLLMLVLSLLPLRERIFRDIPRNLKLATSAGIGLFIAFIGLKAAGLVVADPATLVRLGPLRDPAVRVALLGLALGAVLLARRVTGALIWTVLAATAVAAFVRVPEPGGGWRPLAPLPSSLAEAVRWPDLSVLGRTVGQLDVAGALELGLLTVIFTFTFVDLFDSVGTLAGLAARMGILRPEGDFPGAGRALVADAGATVLGAVLGTSTVTSYVESAAGIAQGGRTGLVAVTTGVLFLLATFLWPLAEAIPAQATAPVLVLVGYLMLEPVRLLDLDDATEAIPAFLTLLAMPLTFSIANGLVFGILSYVLLKLLTGRGREVTPTLWVLAAVFGVYLAVGKG